MKSLALLSVCSFILPCLPCLCSLYCHSELTSEQAGMQHMTACKPSRIDPSGYRCLPTHLCCCHIPRDGQVCRDVLCRWCSLSPVSVQQYILDVCLVYCKVSRHLANYNSFSSSSIFSQQVKRMFPRQCNTSVSIQESCLDFLCCMFMAFFCRTP